MKGRGTISVGNFLTGGSGVSFISENHDYRYANMQASLADELGLARPVVGAPIAVGHAAWVGDGAILLSGSSVGDGCVIGAGSVVSGEFPPMSIVAGVPARVLRPRFPDEMTEYLLALRWWMWDDDQLRRNQQFFSLDLSSATVAEVQAAVVQ